jgi:hypothetical protein
MPETADTTPVPRATYGRKSKLTPDVLKRITDALKSGNYRDTAAAYAGIGVSTLALWMQKGRAAIDRINTEKTRTIGKGKNGRTIEPKPTAQEQPYVDLVDAVKGAESEAEARMVMVVQKAAIGGEWTAAMTYLERKFPEKWGRKDRLALDVDLKKLSTEELETIEAIMAKARTEA